MNYELGTRDYGLPGWKSLSSLKDLIPIDSAEGVFLFGADGKSYFDFNAGVRVSSLGHNHPKLNEAIINFFKKEKATFVPPIATTAARNELCQRLAQLTGLSRVFLCESGASACEAAIQMVRSVHGHSRKRKILSLKPRSYHGGTNLALSVGDDPRRDLVGPQNEEDVIRVPSPIACRDVDDPVSRALEILDSTISRNGHEVITAMILEPVIGTGGVYPLPAEYLQGARKILSCHHIFLIADEIMTGYGRTGSFLACEQAGIVPDVLLLSKGITNGVFPFAATAVSERIAEHFRDNPVPAGSTNNAHPLGCAIAVAVLDLLKEEGVYEHVRAMEQVASLLMQALVDDFPIVKEFRLKGLMGAIEFQDEEGREFALGDPFPVQFGERLLENNIMTLFRGGIMMCSPPLCITKEELEEAFALIRKSLKECGQ